MRQPIAWTRITVDTFVARGPLLFYGVAKTSPSAAQVVDIYDGFNATGRRVMRAALTYTDSVPTVRNAVLPVMLPAPILLERGLFMDLAFTAGEVTVFYRHLREEQLAPRAETRVEA